jgi:hypothetical protein
MKIMKIKKIIKNILAFTLVFPFIASAQSADAPTIKEILANFLSWLLAIFGLVALIAFIVSGIIYMTSAGNEAQAETAKKAFVYSTIGIIVGLSGYVVISTIDALLSGGTP